MEYSMINSIQAQEALPAILAAAVEDTADVNLTPAQIEALSASLATKLPNPGEALREVLGSLDEENV